jgi:hypothetical protein
MSEKQTTFFTVNCAEKLESPNQCISVLEKVQPKLGVLVGLEAEPKLQISILISVHAKLGVSVLISAQAEVKTATMNFSATEIPSADNPQPIR